MMRPDLLGGDEVPGHLVVQRQDVVEHRRRRAVVHIHRTGIAGDDALCVLPGDGRREQPGIGLPTEPDGVLGHDPLGVGVVGGDVGLPVEGELVDEPSRTELGEPFADATGEFAGRLAGER